MENILHKKLTGVKKLTKEEMKIYDGGKMTAKQEIWLERGVAFILLGLAGVLIYELGRVNG
jgi:hypothetical protein